MDKALEIYTYILKEHLSKCFANQQNINPVALNKERFKTKAVFTAAIIFLKNNFKREDCKIVSATNHWLNNYFSDENLFSSIIENTNESLIKLIDDNLCNLIGVESIDIPALYEILLSIETGNETNRTEISTAKNYRNKLGSYYTPANLAKSVTEKTIDAFFELNFGINKLSVNISAFDVDCLALEVAKLNLLLKINQPSFYNRLKENFVHANFLLQTNFAIDESKKVEFFSSGFIYHEQLSLHRNKLKKYDVVLGNPPWEKIRF